jgi:hypothetical protein
MRQSVCQSCWEDLGYLNGDLREPREKKGINIFVKRKVNLRELLRIMISVDEYR